MNTKRFLLAWVAAFAVIFAFEWVFHGVYMRPLYVQTASLWRPEAEMKALSHWMFIGQFLGAGFFSYIFTKGYENKGVGEGLRYGLLIGGFFAVLNLVMYSVAPYPGTLVVRWMIGEVAKFSLAGIAVAAVYRPAK